MQLYKVSGELMKGFLGHITYETILPDNMSKLLIEMSFDKRKMENVRQEDTQACIRAWENNFSAVPDEKMIQEMIHMQKTEINVSVYHNQAYLGCAHRDEMCKKICISSEGSSEGFRLWKPSGGNLKVILHVYQMLNDNTPYTVVVEGR